MLSYLIIYIAKDTLVLLIALPLVEKGYSREFYSEAYHVNGKSSENINFSSRFALHCIEKYPFSSYIKSGGNQNG